MKLSISDIQSEINESYKEIDDLTSSIIKSYTDKLDDIMEKITNYIIKPSNYDKYLIIEYFIKLSSEVYYTNSNFDKVKLYQTVSSLIYSNQYNIIYLKNRLKDSEKKNKMTVAELNAISENATINEKVMNSIYEIVSDTIKNKIASANTMISTLSKILSVCMQENSIESNTNIKQKNVEKETIYG